MNEWPKVVAGNQRFRIVRTEQATYMLEKADGCDALGVERWRECRIGEADTVTRILRDYIIDMARERAKETE